MKRNICITTLLTAALLLISTNKSFAYEGDIEGLGGDTHNYLSYDIFAVYSLKPYFNELTRRGYSLSNFAKHSNWEPDPQHSWPYAFDEDKLWNFRLNENSTGWNWSRGGTTTNEFSFGALLHAIADSAVPAKHTPVEWEYDAAHDKWESDAVDIIPNYNSQPSPTEYLSGSWSAKEDALYALKSAYVAEYQKWWNGNSSYSMTQLQYWAAKVMQIAADVILKKYFDGLEILTEDYILIDWTFDEGDSIYGSNHQYIYNHHGSLNINLVRGWTHGSDTYDGTWDTGFDGTGAWHGKLKSENGGGQTYCKSFGMTGSEARTLTKVGVDDKSFALEFVINPDSLPTSSVEDDVNPPTLLNFYDAAGGPGKWHLTGFYKNAAMHDCVRFDYRTSINTDDSLTIDLTSEGMTITAGKWYYVAVDYNYDAATLTGVLRLLVRDMVTGAYKTTSKEASPAKFFYSASTPLMLIGGDSDDSDLRPFDGKIDRIRYHNKAIANSRRLHWTSTLAHWKFNENAGQTVANSSGSNTARLQFGSLPTSDSSDPTWTAGRDGSAMLGRKYTAGNVAVYAQNMGWTLEDAKAFCPGNSYSVETIVNPSSYATVGTWNNVNPMGMVKFKDLASGGKTQFNLQTFTDNDLRRKVRFYSQHDDGTYTDFIFDPQEAGLTINTGTWYYIAAIYTDIGTGLGTLEIVVKNMSSGTTVSGSTACKPMASLKAEPSVQLLVGSEYTNSSGRCFDGKIDEVRISNTAVSEADRLSNSFTAPTVPLTLVGYWPLNGNATDASGNGNHGSTVGGVTWVAGQKGLCAKFNGTNSGINIANPANFEFTDEVSFSFWVNQPVQTTEGGAIVMCKRAGSGYADFSGWSVFTGPGWWSTEGMNPVFVNPIQNAHRETPSCVDEWHHIAVTLKDKVLTTYYDGQVASAYNDRDLGNNEFTAGNGQPLSFGYAADPTSFLRYWWNGQLDEVRFYHGILTQSDVINLYQQDGGILCQGETIPEDINEDCRVDFEDLALLMSQWLWRGYN